MRCANADCCCDSFELPGGSIRLMELDGPRGDLSESDDYGLPVRSRPVKCFWLCVECSRRFTLVVWTASGVILAPRHSSSRYGTAELEDRAAESVGSGAYAQVEMHLQ